MKVKLITRIEDLPTFNPEEPVFCDIETQGLYVGVRLIQFYQPNNIVKECETCASVDIVSDASSDNECFCNSCDSQREIYYRQDNTIYLFDLAPIGYDKPTYEKTYSDIREIMSKLWLVFYNGSYDLGTMNFVPNKLDDLFYAVKTAYCEFMEFPLDKVIEKLGYGPLYAALDKKKLQKQGFVLGAYLSQAQLTYASTDVYVMSKMWKDPRIQDVIQNNLAYSVDMLSQRYAIQYQQNGLVVDLLTRNKLLNEYGTKIADLRMELPEGFNPNSFKQVREYLGTDKSDKDTLVKYALSGTELADKAKYILELKRSLKAYSYLESINFEKMYTKFNVAGAATGRFTASGGDLDNGFNSQQIPRQFQKLFKADTEDTTVVGLDYSTLELRLACAIFGEPFMYEQLKAGKDLHTEMAILATGKELHKDGLQGVDDNLQAIGKSGQYVTHNDRSKAKCINFGYVFGMSAETYQNYAFVSYGVTVSLEESKSLRAKYFSRYPNFGIYHKYVWDNYKKPSFYYETALGRRVKPKLGTDGINGPIQGSGAETTKLAVHYLIKEYPEAIKLIFNVVHDAIYLRVPKEDKELWRNRLASAMVKGWTEISKTKIFQFKDIPMPVGE